MAWTAYHLRAGTATVLRNVCRRPEGAGATLQQPKFQLLALRLVSSNNTILANSCDPVSPFFAPHQGLHTVTAAPVGVDPSKELVRNLGGIRQASLKKMTDPDRPKRPITPWISFLTHFREKNAASADHVKLEGKSVMKSAAQEWKLMSPFDKRRWEEPYEVLKREYAAKYKEYVESGKKDAWHRDPERPKKPLTGFMRYMAEKRPQYSHLKITQQTKEIGALWKSLSADAKLPYEKAYKAEKEKYTAQLQAYKDSGKEEKWLKKVGIADEKAKKQAAEEKAKALEKEKKAKAKATAERAKEKLKKAKEAEKLAKAKAKAAEAAEKAKIVKAKEKEKKAKAKEAEPAKKQKEKDTKLKEKTEVLKKKTSSKS